MEPFEYTIRKATNKDRFGVARLILRTFKPFDSFLSLEFVADSILNHGFDEDDLVMLVDGNRVGFHSLCESNICHAWLEDEAAYYEGKKGLHGALFCIHPDFQRIGLGSKFIQFERGYFKDKYDYIWGGANDKLNNLSFWKKNRDFIKESSSFKTQKTGSTSVLNL